MLTPDRKVRKLMEEYQKTGKLTRAALRADLDVKTARKYVMAGKLPSQMRVTHYWRTRPDPFETDWPEALTMLEDAPELEAKTLFEWLSERHPGRYEEGQLRTFQRRVKRWRALEGPAREVYFPQEHKPGVRMETDFTGMGSLGITIRGEAFPHMVCHSVLVHSNWEWGSVCHSESFLALKKGVQATLARLGRVPAEHWTDHSTAATHIIGGEGRQWAFNDNYSELVRHFGMKPRTINTAKPHENGDIESANGVMKRRLEQHLLLRGHRDFESVEAYEEFFCGVMDRANRLRERRLREELAAMRPLAVRLLPEYRLEEPRVTSWSTVQAARNTYSVPSRLRGERVRARVYEDRVEIYYGGVLQLTCRRLAGESKHEINYRHVIESLIRKPRAFRDYKWRSDMFPTETFRWAYDALCEGLSAWTADLEYLRILALAARTMETSVDSALRQIRGEGVLPRWDTVLGRLPAERPELPDLPVLVVNLGEYDHLLTKEVVV
jgi:hypothetical protein